MPEVIGVVERGQIRVPADVRLPEGARLRIMWDEAPNRPAHPIESEPLTLEDLEVDIQWARETRFENDPRR